MGVAVHSMRPPPPARPPGFPRAALGSFEEGVCEDVFVWEFFFFLDLIIFLDPLSLLFRQTQPLLSSSRGTVQRAAAAKSRSSLELYGLNCSKGMRFKGMRLPKGMRCVAP